MAETTRAPMFTSRWRGVADVPHGLLSDRNIGYILAAVAAPSRARRTPLRVDA
jgi:hypothetical protein